jgi:lipoprotein-releasing system permease protein
MQWPFELLVGWRYTRASRRTRRNGFISFISLVSMVGIALGVAALIIVLSVMNGFQKEVRDRMLGVVSHIEVGAYGGGALPNAAQTLSEIQAFQSAKARVVGAAPFVAGQALIARGDDMRGVLVRGIDPAKEPSVSDIGSGRNALVFQTLQPSSFSVVLGYELAARLGVMLGDKVTLVLPGGQVSPLGVTPRLKQLTVSGVFDSGHYEFDAGMAVVHLEDAQRLFALSGPTGIRVKLSNLFAAREFAPALAASLSGEVYASDWTRQNRNWFSAVQVEKRMMSIILTLIVAVAAFNLVSTLVMTVTDKTADIAILRTLGARPASIMAIFVVQGVVVGVLGTLVGTLLGLGVAFNVDVIVPAIESLFQVSFLPKDIYLLSRMPSDPQSADIVPVVLTSLVLAFVATLYPSWRASRINPAQALRYE